MQRSTILLATVAALATLNACSKKTETASTGTAANTTATAPAPAAAPAPGPMGFPSRKAGLWEQTVASDRFHQTMRMCLDEATDAKMKIWGSEARGKSDCAEQKVTPHLGGGWEFHAVCNMGESGTVTSDGQATGDFNSHYVVDVTSTTSGSPMAQANGVHKIKMEATWKGPCPADMKGGDMELPGGMKINMLDAAAGKPVMPGGGHMDPAQMAAMRKQAEAMARQMKAQQN